MEKTKNILITELKNEKCNPKGEWEEGYNEAIDDAIEIVSESSIFQKETDTNLILDTNAHLFLQNLFNHIKIVYGIEQFKFSKNTSNTRDYIEVWFKYKRYNSDKLERGYFTIKFHKEMEMGVICPKCKKNVKVTWCNLKEIRCKECGEYLFDWTKEGFVLLNSFKKPPNLGDVIKK